MPRTVFLFVQIIFLQCKITETVKQSGKIIQGHGLQESLLKILKGKSIKSLLKWGASFRWSSTRYCPMWNSDGRTIRNTRPTLLDLICGPKRKSQLKLILMLDLKYWIWIMIKRNSFIAYSDDLTIGNTHPTLSKWNSDSIPRLFEIFEILSESNRLKKSWISFLYKNWKKDWRDMKKVQ